MKELHAQDKVTQQMTKGGAVELNKATGGAAVISARDAPISPDAYAENAQDYGAEPVTQGGAAVDRILSERRAHKKRAVNKANREIYGRVQKSPQSSRLQFTDAERADPVMSKATAKSDKAADRYESAKAKIPKEKALSFERVTNEPTGKSAARLHFTERNKPPNGKLTHALERPKQEAALAVHSEVERSNTDGNAGVSAAHFTERAAEGAGRRISEGYKRLKFQPTKAAFRAEEKAAKANAEAVYQRTLRLNPELAEQNPLSKAFQKRQIKRDYAKAFRQGNLEGAKKTAATVKKGAQKAKETLENAAKFAAKHWKGLAIIGAGLLLLILLFSGLSSCAAMFSGGFNAVVGTSYTAEDNDITDANADYSALESELSRRIANIQSEYPGYDEYRLSVDEIGHDPFELASYLTTMFNGYTRAQVQAELRRLFSQQYTLTITPVTETRYRTETRTGSTTYTDAEGNSHTEYYTYEVQVPYSYHILNVSLVNKSLGSAALANLTPEQREMYAVYMETQGNKPELFGDNPYVNRGEYTDYDIPPEALTDTAFAAMIREAEKYLGRAYVWGGSSPATGFDCSGFVSWVVNHSGYNVGRLTANGLKKQCAVIPPSEARPGDLIFFQGTYDVAGASHVGIYVGNGMMIHCGNPISYANITGSYWTQHFYCYGRLP